VGTWSVDDLVAEARRLVVPGERHILGITGAPGAGKSTLAAAVVDALGRDVVLVGMDGFHLANVELERLGRRQRKGAPDTFDAAGFVALLTRLRHRGDGTVYAPYFDRALEESIGSGVPVDDDIPLVITEGNYLLLDEPHWRDVRHCLDACWYVDVDDSTRVSRLAARHEAYGKSRQDAWLWATGSDARNAEIVATSRAAASLVVRLPNL
jgi:pantothenate kinase